MPKKLIIVSFVFPPASGIGGRRWAKFSKHLYRNGYDFKVVANKIWKTEQSNWDHDVEKFQDRVIRVASGYPQFLNKFQQSFTDRVFYKLSMWYLQVRTNGNIFDRSILWKPALHNTVEPLIQQGYKTIVVNCAPYHAAAHLAELKSKYPEIELILDLRDPWEVESTLYGFSSLSEKRKAYENELQDFAIRNADKVISVYESMTSKYQSRYPDEAGKFFTIDNGFDREDFTVENEQSAPTDGHNKIRFLFAGSFYQGAAHILEDFAKSLSEIKSKSPETYKRLEFIFHGKKPDFFDRTLKGHEAIAKHKGMIPLQDVYQKIAHSDFMMLFLLDEMNYSLSTKFYEYISQNKPIVVFAKGGDAGRFVEDNKLGYFANYGQMTEKLIELVRDRDNGVQFSPNQQIDTSQYEVTQLSKKLIDIIES